MLKCIYDIVRTICSYIVVCEASMQRHVCNGGSTLELFLDLVLKCDLLLLLPSYG